MNEFKNLFLNEKNFIHFYLKSISLWDISYNKHKKLFKLKINEKN